MDRLTQLSNHATASVAPPPAPAHPLDPLTPTEISAVLAAVLAHFGANAGVLFNTVTLREPPKSAYVAWSEQGGAKPPRVAYFVVLQTGVAGVQEGVVELSTLLVTGLTHLAGVQPILTVEDLQLTEEVIRNDPEVIRQCELSGVPASQMGQVYCDPWTIGYDERWGASRRLQQALLYWRLHEDDLQYLHPLDFCPIVDTETHEVVFIDIPKRRRPIPKTAHANFYPANVVKEHGPRELKPITIAQPEGVNFKLDGNVISWNNFKMHIGFNYREGIVLSDLSYNDHGAVRPIFHRISLSEMIVPYGSPDFPHQRKHALDIGEYGAGFLTNLLLLGCDCKGAIQYLDACFADRSGAPVTIKRAVCIHEEDDGILYKHSDFRDEFQTTVVTRATKLVVSQIFTAANYEYCIYWNLMQDGTIKLEVRLTGILNTYVLAEGEDSGPWGTQVYPQVNAHNHQHLFSLRMHPRIDGDGNSAAMSDARPSPHPLGSGENMYGNAFYAHKTVFLKVKDLVTRYESETVRSWDMFNPKSINKYSGKPALYKLVSTMCPPLLAYPGSIVDKRAPWARASTTVVPYSPERLYPSGDHVPQWSGDGMRGMREWVGDGEDAIENTDILFFHTFGLTHFPAPEDFPVMPAEPITLLLRPRHFFTENPGLDIVPSYAATTSQVKAANAKGGVVEYNTGDSVSRYANECCKK